MVVLSQVCASRPAVPSNCAGCSRRLFTAAVATAAVATSPSGAGAARSPPAPVTDRNGAVVTMDGWLKSHSTDTPDLVLGLDGEPHFLLTTSIGGERTLQPYSLRASCTHLGCLVQPDPLTGGFSCPCHGSRCAPRSHTPSSPPPQLSAFGSSRDGCARICRCFRWLGDSRARSHSAQAGTRRGARRRDALDGRMGS